MSPVVGLSPVPAAVTAHVRRAPAARYGWQVYSVRPGDTVSDIALRHRTTTGVIIEANHLRHGGNRLEVGSRLWVPRTSPAPHQAHARHAAHAAHVGRTPGAARARVVGTYRVRFGDTIGAIAARHHMSEAALLRLNGLDARGRIYAGTVLRVPAAAPPGRRAARRARVPAYVVTRLRVRPGDTLGAIALRFHVSQASIIKANKMRNPGMVRIGAMLRIPVRYAARPAAHRTGANSFAGRTYSSAVVNAAAANRRYLARHQVPTRLQTRALIVATARRHGVDPRLALAIAWQESGWNQRQVSVANAIGTMQVLPSSGQWASDIAGRRLNLLSTSDNVTAGIVILRSLTRSARTVDQAVAGYYQGLASVQAQGMYPDTKAYVRSVLAWRTRM